MGKYDAIIQMPHHRSDTHAPMGMTERAAQFAPFAVLNGLDAALKEAEEKNVAEYDRKNTREEEPR